MRDSALKLFVSVCWVLITQVGEELMRDSALKLRDERRVGGGDQAGRSDPAP